MRKFLILALCCCMAFVLSCSWCGEDECVDCPEAYYDVLNQTGSIIEIQKIRNDGFEFTNKRLDVNQHSSLISSYPFTWSSNFNKEVRIFFDSGKKCLFLNKETKLDSLDITDTNSLTPANFSLNTWCLNKDSYYPITDYHYQQAVPCSTLQTSAAGVQF